VRRRPLLRIARVIIPVLVGAWGLAFLVQMPRYTPSSMPTFTSFDAFYADKLARSRRLGVRPGNEEKLTRIAPRTPLTVLYVHGFGASRAEGEEVVDRIAAKLGANAYYLRLPGHGLTKEAHRDATFRDWLHEAEEALAMMPQLGERVVVVGSSMGGLIATWLASAHPERVAGLVLASPFYAFSDTLGNVLFALPGGRYLVELAKGRMRSSAGGNPREIAGWQAYWIVEQYYAAVQHLADLKRYAARDAVYRRVRCPVLLLYYPGDRSASVPAMLHAFAELGREDEAPGMHGAAAHRTVAIADGDHVLLSRWVRSDKAMIERAMLDFIGTLWSTGQNR
jgi:pimeloyl-ACP methyl ester carboxylesterase